MGKKNVVFLCSGVVIGMYLEKKIIIRLVSNNRFLRSVAEDMLKTIRKNCGEENVSELLKVIETALYQHYGEQNVKKFFAEGKLREALSYSKEENK
jgi:uncharacterized protein YneF (UPF0154 family)